MARFTPLFVRRSDGKVEIAAKGKRVERNEPTTEQLDQRPDKNGISDYYREVGPDEAKHLDWRRKLGGMLARELRWKDQSGGEGSYILATFPEGYRLYEHVKRTEKDGQAVVKSKHHAAGGNDRQDAYLYGHPFGRRKRYRSPVDYFPHLLWLCVDESGDTDNCGCRYCCPEELEAAIPGAKVKLEKPVKQEIDVKPTSPQSATGMTRQPSVQSTVPKQEPGKASSRPAFAPQQLIPTPLPQRKTTDQQIDSRFRTFTYRPGEMVWFKRGEAWGLGAVLRRWGTPPNMCHYTVQPLSHPYSQLPSVTKSSDLEMRPWLAWSVPRFTNDALNTMPEPPAYDTADWQGLMQKRYGNGDMEVDGSILAAKAIDATYTPFGLTKTTEPEPGVIERHFDGVFLGAEKLWACDPIRLVVSSGRDIMVMHSVIERKRTPAIGQQAPQQSAYLLGDIYTLTTVRHTDPNVPTPAAPNNNPHLPQRLTEDLALRNARTIAAKGTASYWQLIATQTRLEFNSVKGRWYEASLLLPVLQPDFEEQARQGEIKEATLFMNARGDCINSNRAPNLPRLQKLNIRKDTRREAFGRAVPSNTVIRDGLDPPLPENVDPAFDTSGQVHDAVEIDPRFESAESVDQRTHAGESSGEVVGGLDEFMNLDDGLDENAHMPGFGQGYAGQTSQGGYY